MITFKQFIAEIDHDDSVYNKTASDWIASGLPIDASWKKLPTEFEFSAPGFELRWKGANPTAANANNFKLMLVDLKKEQTAVVIELKSKVAKVPGGVLHGVITDSLSARAEYRGSGLVLKVYEALVKNGQVLFSSTVQTTGSRKLWENLVRSGVGEAFVLAEEAAARWYINREPGYEFESALRVLLTGDFGAMNDEAYASSETCWVIVPHDVDIKDIKANAIELPQIKKRIRESAEDDFLFGDCASFAAALQDKLGGEMYALTRRGKALHVFVKREGKNYDVRGARSTNAMARSIVGSIDDFKVEGPFTKDNQPCQAVKPKKVALAAQFIDKNKRLFEAKFVPEWEKPCWVVAINQTLGTPETKIKALAKKAGWDGKSFGAPVHTTIQIAWDVIGKMPDLSQTKAAKDMTPKEYSSTTKFTGMVFTRKHVMPMVNGKVSNFNGHGDEQIIAVATYEKP
jgi:hypothetical protein